MDAGTTLDGDGSPDAASSQGHDSPPSQREVEDDNLRASLADLSNLGSARLGLEVLLTRVATYAVRAIPGADGAGLILLEEDRADIVVTTAPFVSEVDRVQYAIGQGPCVSAAAEARTIVSPSLGADSRWPKFGGRVARLGVHSALSLPLLTADGVVGAMNVYAHAKYAFDRRSAELGEIFAAPAAVAVENAQVLAQAQRLVAQLQSALEVRRVVDQAVGILISRSGVTGEEALERLRTMSQHDHTKLATVAGRIVDEAAARARARHS